MSRIDTDIQPEQKPEKAEKNPAYLRQVRALPCCICYHFDMAQTSPTTAHHVFHGRFGNRKTPDRMAIPLCDGHHQGDRDTSKLAIHRSKQEWAERYGEDHTYTAGTQDAVDGLL